MGGWICPVCGDHLENKVIQCPKMHESSRPKLLSPLDVPTPVSSPELDRFLIAVLRSVGGRLVVNPMDSVIGADETLTCHQTETGLYIYELKEDQDFD